MADHALITGATERHSALTIADLNTAVNHEARVLDTRLAEALGFERPRKIRELITRNKEALERFGEVCSTGSKSLPQAGAPTAPRGAPYYLNRKQALYITAKSSTPKAADIAVQMVEVFDEFLKGDVPALPAPVIEKAGLALMRIGGKTVLVDTKRFKVGPNDRVVRVHHHGLIDIGKIRLDGSPHYGGGVRGYYEAWRNPRRGDPQGKPRISSACVVLGVVVEPGEIVRH